MRGLVVAYWLPAATMSFSRACLYFLVHVFIQCSKRLSPQILNISYFNHHFTYGFEVFQDYHANVYTSTSLSDASSEIFGIRYHAARATAPSLQNIEDLIKLDVAIRHEIGAQLAAIGAGLGRDLKVTKRLVEAHAPTGAIIVLCRERES